MDERVELMRLSEKFEAIAKELGEAQTRIETDSRMISSYEKAIIKAIQLLREDNYIDARAALLRLNIKEPQ